MDSFLAKLKQDAQCSLCSNTLCDPKLLQCFHTFCKSCIKGHAHLNEEDNVFQCPKCSSETLLQELNDVEDLPFSPVHSRMVQVLEFVESEKSCSVSASHSAGLYHCVHCNRSLCDECLKCHATFFKDHQVVSSSEMEEEDLIAMLMRENPCRNHLDNNVELFCKDCCVLVCWTCMNDHKTHKTMTPNEVKAIKKTSLTKTLEEIERVGCNEMEKKQQGDIAIKMKSDGEKAKEEVKKTTKKLMKFLLDQEQQLLSEIQTSVTRADRNLSLIRHNPAAQEYIKNMIDNGTAADMIDLEEEEGSTRFTYNPFKVDTAGIVFDPNKELSQQVMNATLGNVRFTRMSSPVLSQIEGTVSLQPLQKATLSVVTKHSTGELNCDDSDMVDITISPEDDVKGKKRLAKTDGTLRFEFIPRVCGELTVKVKLNGNPVLNSPIKLSVTGHQNLSLCCGEKVVKLQSALNTGSKNFIGVAVNKANSKIAVADFGSDCVRVFSIEGELLLMYGSKGSGQGQLLSPRGLAFLDDVDLVIVDSGNNRVCIINTNTGSLVRTFGGKGKGEGEFCGPFGVHFDENSNTFIVCDTGNGRVQIFTKDGEYQREFSVPSPYSAVTHNGLFYVSDFKKINVIALEEEKTSIVVSTIEGDENFDCQLKKACGLLLDNDHNLLVCDQGSPFVYKFSLDGHLVGKTSDLDRYPRFLAPLNNNQYICTEDGHLLLLE